MIFFISTIPEESFFYFFFPFLSAGDKEEKQDYHT